MSRLHCKTDEDCSHLSPAACCAYARVVKRKEPLSDDERAMINLLSQYGFPSTFNEEAHFCYISWKIAEKEAPDNYL